MPKNKTPRLLVVDDDLGVIAAYRLVLEKLAAHATVPSLFGLEDLESELFGTPDSPEAHPEWRIKFLDQGMDAVREIEWAVKTDDPYTAAFLDVRMPPGIDGFEAAAQIRKIDASVHIVIVTGFSDYSYDDFVGVAGPAERLTFMTKPVWPDQLRNVARILTNERLNREPAAKKAALEDQLYDVI